jgi:hypothetical protein
LLLHGDHEQGTSSTSTLDIERNIKRDAAKRAQKEETLLAKPARTN